MTAYNNKIMILYYNAITQECSIAQPSIKKGENRKSTGRNRIERPQSTTESVAPLSNALCRSHTIIYYSGCGGKCDYVNGTANGSIRRYKYILLVVPGNMCPRVCGRQKISPRGGPGTCLTFVSCVVKTASGRRSGGPPVTEKPLHGSKN